MHIFSHKDPDTFFSDATGAERYRTWLKDEIEKLTPAATRKPA